MLTLAFAALLAQDAKARAWLATFAQERAGDGTWLALPLLATAVSLLMVWLYRTWAQHRLSVRWARVSLLAVLFAVVLLASLYVVPVALGHNLQTKMVYMFFDPVTQAMLDARIPTITPPTPLLRVGDELGLIIKVVPRDGTTTGVGGYIDFYVPNGTSVVDVAYVEPNAGGGYDRVGMKGQSLIAIGDGPIGAKTTPGVDGLVPGSQHQRRDDEHGHQRGLGARHDCRRLRRRGHFLFDRSAHGVQYLGVERRVRRQPSDER